MIVEGRSASIGPALEKRLEEHPDELELWLELAEFHKSRGDYSGAVAAYQASLARRKDWKVELSMALSLEQMGRFKAAEPTLLALEKDHPQDPWVLWGLGQLRYFQSQWKSIRGARTAQDALKEARNYFRRLTEVKPRFALGFWRLAEVERLLGEDDAALKNYELVLKKDQSYKKAHGFIAGLLTKKGQYREALAKYEKAMAVEPENQALKKQARAAARLAPDEEKRRQTLRLAQWTKWVPPEAKPIAPSAVTVRVQLASEMGHVLLRGQSDLQVTLLSPAPSGGTTQTPVTMLKGGVDYDLSYIRSHKEGMKDRWVLQDGKKHVLADFDQRLWLIPKDPLKTVLVHAVASGTGYFFAKEEDRAYRGVMEVMPHEGRGFALINRVGLEDYCAGVLPAEMSATWPMEALKAQAVAARTYVMTRMGSHEKDGFDVVDSVADQAYRGLIAEEERSNEAVRQTAGAVLKHRGEYLKAYFSAECGGHTQDSLEAWGHDPAVVGVEDFDPRYNQDMEFPLSPLRLKTWIQEDRPAWCRLYELRGYQNYRWVWVAEAADMAKKFPELGRLRRLSITSRSTAGWAKGLTLEGERGTKEYRGDSLRRYLGGVRSNLVWIEPQMDPQGWPVEFIVYGGGWGHGVGMCQVGCYGLAKAGKEWMDILRHYFPKARIERLGQ